jgi:hypothetical protein
VIIEENEKSIKETMLNLRKRVASGNVAFIPDNTTITLNGNQVVGIDGETQMEQVLEIVNKVADEGGPVKAKKKQQQVLSDFQVMAVSVILKRSKDGQDEKLKREACKVVLDSKNR